MSLWFGPHPGCGGQAAASSVVTTTASGLIERAYRCISFVDAVAYAQTLPEAVGKVRIRRETTPWSTRWVVRWNEAQYLWNQPSSTACTCGTYWSVIPQWCPAHGARGNWRVTS